MRISDGSSDVCSSDLLGKQGRVDSGHAAARIDPWSLADGWRISGTYTQTLHLIDNGQTSTLRLHRDADGWTCGESEHARHIDWRVDAAAPGQYQVHLRLDDLAAKGTVVLHRDAAHIFTDGNAYVRSEEHTSELQSLM